MAENSKCIVDRNKIKQRNFAESETKHFVRNHGKNTKNAIFRKRHEGTSILGQSIMQEINAGAREKEMPCMWSMDDIKSVTALSVNDFQNLVQDRKKWRS